MTPQHESSHFGDGRWDALGRAAVAAHWLPGIGFELAQRGRRNIQVTPWRSGDTDSLELHPCEFRQQLLLARDLPGFDGPIASEIEAAATLRMLASPAAELLPFGIMQSQMEGRVILAVALTPMEVEACTDAGCAPSAATDPQLDDCCTQLATDDDLTISLVHRCVEPDDPDGYDEAHQAMTTVASVAATAALLASLRSR